MRAAAVAAVLLAPAVAHAGSEDTLGLLPEDMALAGSLAARLGSAAAVYHNPAALAPFEDAPGFAEVELGALYAHPAVYARDGAERELALAAPARDTIAGVLGARFDLGSPFDYEGLALGATLAIPSRNLFRWSIHPDDAPQWLFLTDRTQHVNAMLGLGWRPLPWLALGAGLRVMFDVATFTTARVTSVESVQGDDGATSIDVSTQLGEDVTVLGKVAPNVGLVIAPHRSARLGLAYRGQSYVDDWGATRIQGVPGAGDLGYVHRFAHYFHPHTVAAAIAARPLDALELSFDLAWARWSDALTTNHASLPGRLGDTLTPAAAVSYGVGVATLQGGYRYQPSPFENFGGPTNLLDNDAHVASAGSVLRLGGPAGLAFELHAALRCAFLVERAEQKDPRRFASDEAFLNNPAVRDAGGRYHHGGAVPGGALTLEAKW